MIHIIVLILRETFPQACNHLSLACRDIARRFPDSPVSEDCIVSAFWWKLVLGTEIRTVLFPEEFWSCDNSGIVWPGAVTRAYSSPTGRPGRRVTQLSARARAAGNLVVSVPQQSAKRPRRSQVWWYDWMFQTDTEMIYLPAAMRSTASVPSRPPPEGWNSLANYKLMPLDEISNSLRGVHVPNSCYQTVLWP